MDWDFGSKLAYLRKQNFLSQRVLAKILKRTQPEVSYWEKNDEHNLPRLPLFRQICLYFKVSADWLLSLVPSPGDALKMRWVSYDTVTAEEFIEYLEATWEIIPGRKESLFKVLEKLKKKKVAHYYRTRYYQRKSKGGKDEREVKRKV